MKKTINTFLLAIIGLAVLVSCEENEIPIFDTENGPAIAGFNGAFDNTRVIFNPAEDTESTITIGVSTLSSSDRNVQISIDEEASTLDPSFYTISTLTPVISAGSFTTDITITTLASTDLPGASDAVVLVLESVEGAEFLTNSITTLSVALDVQCPTVDIPALAGNYDVVASTFAGFFLEKPILQERSLLVQARIRLPLLMVPTSMKVRMI